MKEIAPPIAKPANQAVAISVATFNLSDTYLTERMGIFSPVSYLTHSGVRRLCTDYAQIYQRAMDES